MNEDTLLGRPLGNLGRVRSLDFEQHDVRIHRWHLDSGNAAQARCEPARAEMILGEAFSIVLERVQRGGRQDSGLAHGSAEHLAEAPRCAHSFVRTDEGGADWRTVEVPFADLKTVFGKTVFTGGDLTEVEILGSRPGGQKLWLEIDNVSFY